jgi:hypothetical protein
LEFHAARHNACGEAPLTSLAVAYALRQGFSNKPLHVLSVNDRVTREADIAQSRARLKFHRHSGAR